MEIWILCLLKVIILYAHTNDFVYNDAFVYSGWNSKNKRLLFRCCSCYWWTKSNWTHKRERVYDSCQLHLDCQKQNMLNEYRSQRRNIAETIHSSQQLHQKTIAPNGNAVTTVYCTCIYCYRWTRKEKEKKKKKKLNRSQLDRTLSSIIWNMHSLWCLMPLLISAALIWNKTNRWVPLKLAKNHSIRSNLETCLVIMERAGGRRRRIIMIIVWIQKLCNVSVCSI